MRHFGDRRFLLPHLAPAHTIPPFLSNTCTDVPLPTPNPSFLLFIHGLSLISFRSGNFDSTGRYNPFPNTILLICPGQFWAK
jgi:hypothetical protein